MILEKMKQSLIGNGDVLSIDMSMKNLRDLIFDPDLDKYLDEGKPIIVTKAVVERILKCKIFTHSGNMFRNNGGRLDKETIVVTFRKEISLEEKVHQG